MTTIFTATVKQIAGDSLKVPSSSSSGTRKKYYMVQPQQNLL